MPVFFVLILFSFILRLVGMTTFNLLAEEAYYWNYSLHLDWGYLDHPPMVACLIKLFTFIFGTSEFGVRCAALFCWGLTTFYSYKWCNLVKPGSGYTAILLLSILPFFFLQSLFITPDLPLLLCWSASLYYLYRSLVLNEQRNWYWVGLWLGLGLVSKYSMILIGLGIILYMLIVPEARRFFFQLKPYLAALLALLIFSPVLYWNAENDWASFIFQSTRRFQDKNYFSLHELIGLTLLFLTPMGIYGLWRLLRYNSSMSLREKNSRYFMLIFTFTPLIFFSLFSLFHEIKFNWIGPGLLAVIPWLAVNPLENKNRGLQAWFITAMILFIIYTSLILCIWSGKPITLHRSVLSKYIAWDDLSYQMYTIAAALENQKQKSPILVPLDRYNIGSELNFYQTKMFRHQKISKIYPVVGSHVFGGESLMYSFWDKHSYHNELVILISTDYHRFYYEKVLAKTRALSSIKEIWAHSQRQKRSKIRKYFYQEAMIK